MYRIISGKWKGRRVVAPKNFEVRPTTDFAKEGLFNILNNRYDFPSIVVLDLFAGIGSISLEFCSRGVQQVTAVDQNLKHCQFIEKTGKDLGADEQLIVVCSEVGQFLQNNEKHFNIVFSDAPFDSEVEDYSHWVETIFEKEVLLPEGLLIVEHNSKLKLEEIPRFTESRKYGNITFSFFE